MRTSVTGAAMVEEPDPAPLRQPEGTNGARWSLPLARLVCATVLIHPARRPSVPSADRGKLAPTHS